jgi:DNA polymerase
MAAQTVFGGSVRLTAERGRWRTLAEGTRACATWHPSAVLRAPTEQRVKLYEELVRDLAAVRRQ